jgi:hypothetical protein
MMYGGRFNRLEPKYVGDDANNGVWRLNEVYALREAGLWPDATDLYKDIYFESNKVFITSRDSNIIDASILNLPLTVSKFSKQIIDGPDNNPINALYNDDYSNANGDYAYITTGSNTELIISDQDYTIECWFKPIRRQPNGYYTLFSTYINGNDGAVFGFDNDGRIFADGGFGNWAFGNITGGVNVGSGTWHHIAFCRSNGVLKCFVNGSQYGSSANSAKVHSTNTLRIGNYSNQSFVGHITEVRLAVGVARYTSMFSVPTIPFPYIEQEIAPLAPSLSSDSLYGNESIELFWRNVFNGGSDITDYDIAYSINSDMSDSTINNLPVAAPTGPIDRSWNTVSTLLHFDGSHESSSFEDDGPNSFSITNNGTPIISTTQSKFGGSSAYFNGSSYISLPASDKWNLSSGDFTIEGWIYYTADGQYRGIIGSRQNSTGSGWCLYIHPNGTFYMGSVVIGQGYSDRQLNTTSIPANTWTHFAFVKSSDGYRVYLNGVAGSLLALTSGLEYQSSQNLVIGALGSQGEYPFLGYIDELRFTKGLARYSSNFTVQTSAFPDIGPTPLPTSYTISGLNNNVPYYCSIRANNVIGNGIYSNIIGPITPSSSLPQRLIGGDLGLSSGTDPNEYNVGLLLHFDGDNGNTTTSNAANTTISTTFTGNAQISTSISKFGGSSLSLDGSGDYITINSTNIPAFNTGDFTIECWIYPTAWNDNAVVLGGSSANGLQLGRYSTSNSFGVAKQGVAWYITDAELPPLNQWTHVAVTRISNVLKIWINGVQSGSSYSSAADFSFPSNQIGAGGGGSFFTGYIDELRITNGVGRTISVPTTAYPNPAPTPRYIGVSYNQDDYWYSTSRADKIFDNNLADNNENQWKARSTNRAFGVNFGVEQTVLRYKMWRNTGNQNTPTSWVLQGSNTESDWSNLQNNAGNASYGNWQTIDTRNNVYLPLVSSSSPASNPHGLFVVASPGSYKYYRLFVSAVRADGPGTEASRVWVAEMQFLALVPAAPITPTNLEAFTADGSAIVNWDAVGLVDDFIVEWSEDQTFATTLGTTTSPGQSATITGLVNGTTYYVRVKSNYSGIHSAYTSAVSVVPAEGYTPIEDNILRFHLSEATTGINVNVNTTSGYAKLEATDGTTTITSSVASTNAPSYAGHFYSVGGNLALTGLATGVEKIVKLISCDAGGNPSGELVIVDFNNSSNNGRTITLIDASGCLELDSILAGATGTNYQPRGYLNPGLTVFRALSAPFAGNNYAYHAPTYINVRGTLNLSGQLLSGPALNQLYDDLPTGVNNPGGIVVGGNSGISDDDPGIATGKGYTVYGS